MQIKLPIPPQGWQQKPAGISLCMIVKNEERFLDQCLRSVARVVDEINVVDTGSTDATIDIARAHGARIEHRAWRNDFSWARNEALSMATKRWVLVLDADEVLSTAAAETLAALRDVPAYLQGLWIRCKNYEDTSRGSEGLVNAIVRVFPSHERIRFRNTIHEFISLDDDPQGMPASDSPIEIIHYGYTREVMAERGKLQRNLDICRDEAMANPDDAFAWYNLGMTAMLAGDRTVALEALEKMRSLLSGSVKAYLPHGLAALAELYLQTGTPHIALRISEECIAAAPTFPNAHFTHGKVLVALGRLHDARDSFGEAIAAGEHAHEHHVIDPDVPAWKAQNEIGATLMTERRYDFALKWFELGLENRQNAQPLQLNRARALELLGQRAEAEAAFERAYYEFRDNLSTTEYVNFLLRHDRNDQALTIIDQASSYLDAESKVKFLGSAAMLGLRASDEPSAIAYLRRALEVTPEAAEFLETLFAHFGDPVAQHVMRRVCDDYRSSKSSGLRLNTALA